MFCTFQLPLRNVSKLFISPSVFSVELFLIFCFGEFSYVLFEEQYWKLAVKQRYFRYWINCGIEMCSLDTQLTRCSERENIQRRGYPFCVHYFIRSYLFYKSVNKRVPHCSNTFHTYRSAASVTISYARLFGGGKYKKKNKKHTTFIRNGSSDDNIF